MENLHRIYTEIIIIICYFRLAKENNQNMKQKPTFKAVLFTASIFSLFAFVFVNVHANVHLNKGEFKTEFIKPQVEEENNEREMGVPAITVLGRVWEIAHKLIEKRN